MKILQPINRMKEVMVGSLLVAKPNWNDLMFQRSVVLIIAHGESGTTGTILNKPSNLGILDALPELGINAALHYGGRHDMKTVSYIHRQPDIPGCYPMCDDIFWGGDYQVVRHRLQSGILPSTQIRFMAGFVKWRHGELRMELKDNRWWVMESSPVILEPHQEEDLWSELLLREHHPYGLMKIFPDPGFN